MYPFFGIGNVNGHDIETSRQRLTSQIKDGDLMPILKSYYLSLIARNVSWEWWTTRVKAVEIQSLSIIEHER
jgi:hypothetical protein